MPINAICFIIAFDFTPSEKSAINSLSFDNLAKRFAVAPTKCPLVIPSLFC